MKSELHKHSKSVERPYPYTNNSIVGTHSILLNRKRCLTCTVTIMQDKTNNRMSFLEYIEPSSRGSRRVKMPSTIIIHHIESKEKRTINMLRLRKNSTINLAPDDERHSFNIIIDLNKLDAVLKTYRHHAIKVNSYIEKLQEILNEITPEDHNTENEMTIDHNIKTFNAITEKASIGRVPRSRVLELAQ